MMPVLTFHIITLFPESFESYLRESIIGRALREKKIAVRFYNPRDFTAPKPSRNFLADSDFSPARKFLDGGQWFYRQTDDRPYGGGPGMVMIAKPILKAVQSAKRKAKNKQSKIKTILFSPSGKQFTNQVAINWAKKYTDLILICGRYEGIDARVKKILKAEEVSIGPYVLTGGELPAMAVIDTAARQVEGVLGRFESLEEKRLSTAEVYTRPAVLVYNKRRYAVPKILLSGHHGKIEEWKKGKK